jgi:SAM-dependent methyltransferase
MDPFILTSQKNLETILIFIHVKRKDNIIDEFDQFIHSYTQDMIRWVPNYLDMLESIATAIPDSLEARDILDLGCGNGNATQIIFDKYPKANYTLLDASKEMLDRCRRRFIHGKIESYESYFMDARFDKNSFDIVIASFSLHHLKNMDKQEIFQRIRNWLRPGGIFVYTDLMIDREDKILHKAFLEEWEAQAKSQGTTVEEWDWLMEHHQIYDFTQDYQIQQNYLTQAGFSKLSISWRKDFWTTLSSYK